MATSRQWRNYRPSRGELLVYGVSLVAIAIYFAVLHDLNGRAESYFKDLRVSNPELYLTQIRESRSFPVYLDEYRTMRGYDSFKPAAPSFLVGRWTMQPEPLRLNPGTTPADCAHPITFDYGILLMLESSSEAFRVSYSIEGQKVLVKEAGLNTFPVDLVSYGARLDHLEFTPPGATEKVYAYECAR
ncbi:hypothetical protein [Pseudodonghicola xiamenensis]|uniref:Uncharacterized protein n=1 Tax=Pseudodonghicola xiamenensis TaxID=337702 RepID=A0A8J3MDF9_9RHOB|nr:hypothetical protein [Pseudodonghicola xiamenensis]GHG95707.1 hypothetical protein GCM10010961_29610 [Pseudodonghicola xiamenensis]